jgi:hypothetical protein
MSAFNGSPAKSRRLQRISAAAGLLVAATVLAPASPASAAVGIYRVSAVSASDSVSPKTATASCNVGDKATDAGGHISLATGDVILTRAFIEDNMNQATAMGVESIATTSNWDVTAWVICAPAGTITNQVLVQTSLGYDPSDKLIVATCPPGKVAYGGGHKVVSAGGNAAIDEKRFTASFTSVTLQTYDAGGVGDYTATVQASCGDPLPQMSLQVHDSANNSIASKTDSPNTCPNGQETTGVGAMITGLVGAGSIDTLRPKAGMTAGEVIVREIGPNVLSNWRVQSQVMCAG